MKKDQFFCDQEILFNVHFYNWPSKLKLEKNPDLTMLGWPNLLGQLDMMFTW